MVPCALLVSSAHHKRSTGARSNNGEHLDRGQEKAASRIARRFMQTIRLRSRQKWDGFPSPGIHFSQLCVEMGKAARGWPPGRRNEELEEGIGQAVVQRVAAIWIDMKTRALTTQMVIDPKSEPLLPSNMSDFSEHVWANRSPSGFFHRSLVNWHALGKAAWPLLPLPKIFLAPFQRAAGV
jgi:hypothetical protein